MARNRNPTIYDANARAPFYRESGEWKITVSGYNDDGDFVYRVIRVPLNTAFTKLGELAIETMKGYRYFERAESDRLIDVFNETVSVDDLESDGSEAVAGIFRDGKALRVSARWRNDEVYKAQLSLDASADAIGTAVLEGYARLDEKFPKLRESEQAAILKRARRRK